MSYFRCEFVRNPKIFEFEPLVSNILFNQFFDGRPCAEEVVSPCQPHAATEQILANRSLAKTYNENYENILKKLFEKIKFWT